MDFLLLSILASSLNLVLFKIAAKKEIPSIFLIILNYFPAVVFGYMLSGITLQQIFHAFFEMWLAPVIVGSIYVFTFFLIGETVKKSGIAITTIASKMSFIIPITLSLIIDPNDNYSSTKVLLVGFASLAVLLSVYKSPENRNRSWLFPLILFLLLGFVDGVVKYMQTFYIKSENSTAIFSTLVFLISAICSLIIWSLYGKERVKIFRPLTLLLGLILGLSNFGSLYFFVNSLNRLKFHNSLVIGINNVGVVVLSIAIAMLFFKEKLEFVNKVGIVLSIFVLALLSYFF